MTPITQTPSAARIDRNFAIIDKFLNDISFSFRKHRRTPMLLTEIRRTPLEARCATLLLECTSGLNMGVAKIWLTARMFGESTVIGRALAAELRRRGARAWEVEGMMGHKRPGVIETRAQFAPDYSARDARRLTPILPTSV
ncbi:hypothetical protein GGD83_002394 [Rhodoblastus sphagnicola]|uniref:hypothetical protein n=1 Tax=Rhodoblastus sphagnicola TaxID=333368 RepID=UPI001304A903|nr:hypothetical protein [Rhodoblastus sphagnicola]MBB4198590.1 hypothetical protein [Rhodoblastus sphagnicola]